MPNKKQQRPLAETPSREPAIGEAVDRDSLLKPRIPLNAPGVPESLKDIDQWVGWRIKAPAKPGDKIGKVPVNPRTGHDASTTDPETWGTFEEALAAVGRYELAGVGFVFTKASGIVGVDLDKCRDPDTGAIEPWAEEIVAALDSYTEISPTGMGVHVLARGGLPSTGRRRDRVEMYEAKRFFTVTGHPVPGGAPDIEQRDEAVLDVHARCIGTKASGKREVQAPLEAAQPSAVEHCIQIDMTPQWTPVRPRIATSDEELLAAARRAKNGAKFTALFDEGRIDDYPSPSEADSALIALLAFWTGPDAARIDGLFRRSKLMRPKWDEARGDTTYGALTVSSVLATANTFFEPPSGPGTVRSWKRKLGGIDLTCEPLGMELTQIRAKLPSGRELVDKYQLRAQSGRLRVAERISAACPEVPTSDVIDALEGLAVEILNHREEAATCADGADGSSPTSSIAERLVSLVDGDSGVELFHTPGRHDAEAYATITEERCRVTHSIKGRGFRYWLTKRYRDTYDEVPSSQGINDGLNGIVAAAVHDGDAHPVHLRVAAGEGCVWIDLCDDTGKAVCVDAAGWRVVHGNEVPIRFLRRGGMQALPEPVRGGSINELRPFVNLPDEPSWCLYVCVGVTYLLPGGPYVVLVVNGEQGSAKSTTMRVLRAVVDPNKVALRRPPRDEKDLMIAANNAWIVAYDNISSLPVFLSDAICSLATGGGFGSRQLFTDDEEKLFEAMRPVMLNGIEDVATRADLLDRAIILTLPVISDEARKEESEQRPAFEAVRARVFGALLDGVSTVLRMRSTVKFDRKPRMADFSVSAVACASAYGWTQAQVIEAMEANRSEANEVAIGNSLVAGAILRELEGTDEWSGTATELLERLSGTKVAADRSRAGWPANPRALRGALNRVAPSLRRVGIHFDFGRVGHKNRRLIQITKVGKTQVAPVAPSADGPGDSANAENCERSADGRAPNPAVPSAPDRPQNHPDDPENLDSDPDANGATCADGRSQTLEVSDFVDCLGADSDICGRCGGDELVRLNDGRMACVQCDAPESDDVDGGGS